jgi:hypothetical protein
MEFSGSYAYRMLSHNKTLHCAHGGICVFLVAARGSVVVKALGYKLEGRWFETR